MKRFYAALYQAEHQPDLPPHVEGDLLGRFADNEPQVIARGDYRYELIVERIAPGRYRGELKRYGNDDLPHAGRPRGHERELELSEEEMTIERNYFLFHQDTKVLTWQENRRASSTTMLSRYVSDVLGFTVTFAPLLTQEATRAFLLQRHRPKVIEFSVARPLNPSMYEGTGESERILRLIAGLDGLTGSFRISANSVGIAGRVLDAARVFRLGNELVESGHARKVRLELEGLNHPIDLITDRLRTKIEVEMAGRYPARHSVFAALQAAREELSQELTAILG
jgi:hypothetical protein